MADRPTVPRAMTDSSTLERVYRKTCDECGETVKTLPTNIHHIRWSYWGDAPRPRWFSLPTPGGYRCYKCWDYQLAGGLG